MTIDRAIEILNPERREHYDSLDELNEACRMGMEALERTRWIPCSERLPKVCKDTSYLSYIPSFGVVDIADYHPDVDEWTFMGMPITVTHWMPLPEPPEEGDCKGVKGATEFDKWCYRLAHAKVQRIIADAPIEDAVPVVRCKDCKHYEMGVCLKIYSDGNVSKDAWQRRKPVDFCSYGERKDGGDSDAVD